MEGQFGGLWEETLLGKNRRTKKVSEKNELSNETTPDPGAAVS
jgi:hypothetical protein